MRRFSALPNFEREKNPQKIQFFDSILFDNGGVKYLVLCQASICLLEQENCELERKVFINVNVKTFVNNMHIQFHNHHHHIMTNQHIPTSEGWGNDRVT